MKSIDNGRSTSETARFPQSKIKNPNVVELAVAGNAKIVATNNIKDFKGAELIFPDLLILKPDQIIRS